MHAYKIKDKIIIEDEKSASRLYQKGFGKKSGNKLELSLIEGLFLLERGSIKIRIGDKIATPKDILEADENFAIKYRVYKDLREKGLIVKTGFKFGAHFRVYDRSEYPSQHSKYLVHAVTEDKFFSFPEIARAVRLARAVNKTMVFAVVDHEGDITYYSVGRITL
jgi:tRNA-intron endonuclease